MAALAFQSNPAAADGTNSHPGLPPPQWPASLTGGKWSELSSKAAKQSPDDFAAQQRLGEFYLQQNRLPEGIVYLEKAQRLNPQDYDSGYDLSLAYLNSGDTGKASAQLRKMIAQHETAELDNLLAEAIDKSGDYKGAATEYIAPLSSNRVRRTFSIWPLFCCNIRLTKVFSTTLLSFSATGTKVSSLC